MSWDSKTDFCGLAVTGAIVCKSANHNRSGQYLEKAGQSGAICATQAFGKDAKPSCEYAIQTAHTYSSLKLGAVTVLDDERFALESVHYETAADAEPSLSATAQLVDDSSDGTTRTFDVPAFSVSPDEAAAIVLSAATVEGSDVEVVKSTFEASCSVKPHRVNGTAIASDVTMGRMTVQLEILQHGSAAPAVTPGTGWDLSSPLTCNDPDSDYPVWSCTLSKPLEYTRSAS